MIAVEGKKTTVEVVYLEVVSGVIKARTKEGLCVLGG